MNKYEALRLLAMRQYVGGKIDRFTFYQRRRFSNEHFQRSNSHIHSLKNIKCHKMALAMGIKPNTHTYILCNPSGNRGGDT